MTQAGKETIDQITHSTAQVIAKSLVVVHNNAVDEERKRMMDAIDAYIDEECDDESDRERFKAEMRRKLL